MNQNQYPQINLADWQQVGEGGTAQAYNPGFEADRAAAEFFTARIYAILKHMNNNSNNS